MPREHCYSRHQHRLLQDRRRRQKLNRALLTPQARPRRHPPPGRLAPVQRRQYHRQHQPCFLSCLGSSCYCVTGETLHTKVFRGQQLYGGLHPLLLPIVVRFRQPINGKPNLKHRDSHSLPVRLMVVCGGVCTGSGGACGLCRHDPYSFRQSWSPSQSKPSPQGIIGDVGLVHAPEHTRDGTASWRTTRYDGSVSQPGRGRPGLCTRTADLRSEHLPFNGR